MAQGEKDKEEEIWRSAQETLKEQHYSVTILVITDSQLTRTRLQEYSHYPVVQSLKDLVTGSVHMETSGDPMISAWTAQ